MIDATIIGYSTHKSLSYPSVTVLQSKVNAYLTHFSALESLRNKQLAKQRNIPDDEGFVTVTRGGRTGAGRVEDAQAAQVRLKEREGRRVGSDFYRFQTREEKKKREHDLKRKFEEDRRRVEVLRGRRGRVVPE
jgi:ribosomal RNA-processing protein 7